MKLAPLHPASPGPGLVAGGVQAVLGPGAAWTGVWTGSLQGDSPSKCLRVGFGGEMLFFWK